MVLKLLAVVSSVEMLFGYALVIFGSTVIEYAGGAAFISAAVAGTYGLLHKLASDDSVSHKYDSLLTQKDVLIDHLQEDNDRLRLALRQCEERCVE